jgi:hypothetical protein
MLLNKQFQLIFAICFCFFLNLEVNAGSKKLNAINAAEAAAKRAIVETVIGLKIRAKEHVQDMVAKKVTIQAKTTAEIKGIQIEDDKIYDAQRNIAKVVASIKVGQVKNIVGEHIDYGTRTIRRVGFGTATASSAGPIRAMRAAELDAYKKLSSKIVGFSLTSETTVENFLLKNDDIKTKMMAAIYGAEISNYKWDEDGDAYVTLRMQITDVEDVLQQRLDYQGTWFEVEGMGAQNDDFSGQELQGKPAQKNPDTGGMYNLK